MGNISLHDKLLGPKIVVIGGGTGLSVLLRGLKRYTKNITAIVTVADDGGGSGMLRKDLGILPPGDIRSCLLALANTEPKMEKLLEYRFDSGSLKGQSFGNLFLAAMTGIYGSFEEGVKELSNVLAITGRVLPMTTKEVCLYAELENGRIIKGESKIPSVAFRENSRIKKLYIDPEVSEPLPEGIEAIEEADIIVLGPGSLYTSIIPNLLIDDIPEIIYKSKAKKIYVANIITEKGETTDYSLKDHVESLLLHSRPDILDYILVNNNSNLKLKNNKDKLVLLKDEDRAYLEDLNIKIIEDDFLSYIDDDIYHNNENLSKTIMKINKTSS